MFYRFPKKTRTSLRSPVRLALFAAMALVPTVSCAYGTPAAIPYGACGNLDGIIGPEWSQALTQQTTIQYQRTSCACSTTRMPAELYFLHDDENLYVGLSFRTSNLHPSRQIFRAFVFIDNGDNVRWNQGDNLIVVPTSDGQLLATGLDYYYSSRSRSPLERTALDAVQNATGIGRWNAEQGAYQFEISFPMQSGDPFDVPLVAGRAFTLVIGFDVADRYSGSTYNGEASSSVYIVP